MKLAVTGCNGDVGRAVVENALKQGFEVVGIDVTDPPAEEYASFKTFKYIQADLRDYDANLKVFEGCDGLVALAAYRNPGDYVWLTHNTNVVLSWNALRAAAELGIKRVVQASSVNIITLVFSQERRFRYFPIDENHPCEPDEPYGLSKQIAELQADSIVRRYPDMRIASIRLHWSVPNRDFAVRDDPSKRKNDLWGYVQRDRGADAFLLALSNEEGRWFGHEAFFVSAPDVADDHNTSVLYERFWSHIPMKKGKTFSGRCSFFDCSKAERLLGWRH